MNELYIKLNELLFDYAEKFKDTYPIDLSPYESTERVIEHIQDCIKNNEPFVAQYEDGVKY